MREVLRVIEENWLKADLFEVRIDLLKEKNTLFQLRRFREKLIATVRWKAEGGLFSGSEDERLSIYSNVIRRIKPKYVDVEINSKIIKEVVSIAKREGVSVIGSYHNFKETPKVEFLKKIESSAREMEVDLLKIVTMANSYRDNLVIFNFLSKAKIPVISFCMGKYGIISRVISPILGSQLSYVAPIKGVETAPGQLSIDELKSIWRMMGID